MSPDLSINCSRKSFKMIIDVLKLKDGVPTEFSGELDAKQIDVEYVDFHYKEKIKVSGTAEKILNTVTFCGEIHSSAEHVCARCLKAVKESVEDTLNLSYDVKGVERLSLLEDIRDVLLLSHSERFLCMTNCKGLCSTCGINLNEATCHCVQKNQSGAFSELKKLFKPNKS